VRTQIVATTEGFVVGAAKLPYSATPVEVTDAIKSLGLSVPNPVTARVDGALPYSRVAQLAQSAHRAGFRSMRVFAPDGRTLDLTLVKRPRRRNYRLRFRNEDQRLCLSREGSKEQAYFPLTSSAFQQDVKALAAASASSGRAIVATFNLHEDMPWSKAAKLIRLFVGPFADRGSVALKRSYGEVDCLTSDERVMLGEGPAIYFQQRVLSGASLATGPGQPLPPKRKPTWWKVERVNLDFDQAVGNCSRKWADRMVRRWGLEDLADCAAAAAVFVDKPQPAVPHKATAKVQWNLSPKHDGDRAMVGASSLGSRAFRRCVQRVVRRSRYPASKGDSCLIHLSMSFDLRPDTWPASALKQWRLRDLLNR